MPPIRRGSKAGPRPRPDQDGPPHARTSPQRPPSPGRPARPRGINTPIGQILVDSQGLISDKDRNLARAAQAESYADQRRGPRPRYRPRRDRQNPAPDGRLQQAHPDRVRSPKPRPSRSSSLRRKISAPADDIRSFLGFNVIPYIGDPDNVNKLVAKYYDAHTQSLAEMWNEAASDSGISGRRRPRRLDRPG